MKFGVDHENGERKKVPSNSQSERIKLGEPGKITWNPEGLGDNSPHILKTEVLTAFVLG